MVQSQALLQEGKIFLGRSVAPEYLELKLANRHGLVTGATGTGKTVSLQVLAEGFADAGVPVFAADIKGDLAGISEVGQQEGRPRQARQRHRPRRLDQHLLPDRVLGPVRRAGPSRARHRAGDGAAAAVAPAGAQRDAGGRAQHPVPGGGRRGHAAARPQGPARHGQRRRPARQILDDQIRQRRRHLRRRHPAPPAGAGGAGRRQLLRRAGARHQRLHARRAGRARLHQYSGRRQVDEDAAALCDLPAVDAGAAVRQAARGRRSGKAQARVLLRRGAPALQRGAQGAARAGRARHAPDPLQGRRRLLHHAEPARRAQLGLRPARQPHPARAARLHARRAEGHPRRRRDLPPQSQSSTWSA